MVLDRLFGPDTATRFGGLLSVRSTDSDEDPTGAAGDSDVEDQDDLDGDDAQDDEPTSTASQDEDDPEQSGEDDDQKEAAGKRKYRFADQDSAEEGFRELQSHASRLEAENARLRGDTQKTRTEAPANPVPAVEANEAMLAQIGDAVNAEYLRLPKEQQNLASVTKIMMRHVANLTVKAGQQAAQAQQAEIEARNEATTNAKKAMAEAGLDPDKHWDLLILQRDLLNRTDPNTLATMAPQEQFKALATRTRDYLRSIGAHTKDEVKKAKDDHNREAGGTLSGSARRSASRPTADDQDQDTDGKDSMTADLQANRAGLRRRSATQYSLLTRAGASLPRR